MDEMLLPNIVIHNKTGRKLRVTVWFRAVVDCEVRPYSQGEVHLERSKLLRAEIDIEER